MLNSIGNQNKTLRNAASNPKDTSPRLAKSNEYSAKISGSKTSVNKDEKQSIVNFDKSNTKKMQGSYEGLMHSASTVLQQNKVGYDNPSLQKARYNKDFASLNKANFSFKLNNNSTSYSIMNNLSSTTAKDSSSYRLNAVVRANMMFK
jgi:hypothetical protein